jgi:hypothetical protein
MEIEVIGFMSEEDPLEPKIIGCGKDCENQYDSCDHLQKVEVTIRGDEYTVYPKSENIMVIKESRVGFYGNVITFSRKQRDYDWICSIRSSVVSQPVGGQPTDGSSVAFNPLIVNILHQNADRIMGVCLAKRGESSGHIADCDKISTYNWATALRSM